MTRHLRHTIGALSSVAILATAASCERAPETSGTRGRQAGEPRGTDLVVGSTVGEWGLLVLARDGGTASLRRLGEPGEVVWEGSTALPELAEARRVGGSAVALRTPEGEVYLYEPARDALELLGTLESEAVAWSEGDEGGAFVAPATGEILAVTPEGAWRVESGGPVLWAAPVHEGVVVLSPDGETASLRIRSRSADQASAGTELPVRPPGVVTAWGRRVALVDAPEGRALRVLSLDPVETAGRVELDGRVTALAASPSSHQLYAGLADPPRLEVVNRFAFRARTLATLRAPAQSIRPSLFGASLLISDGSGSWSVPVAGGEPRRLAGTWDADLPIGLPDGSVLARTDAGVVRLTPGSEAGAPVEETPDGWWLPVRWLPVPRPAVAEMEPVPVRPGRSAPTLPDAESPDVPVAEQDEAAEETPAEPDGPPSGYYAIVGSARQVEGIRELVEELAGAGYPVRTQAVPDQAGSTWYRGLVGPYPTRAEAEAAARQLQRERRLQSWVTGIGFDG